MKRNCIIGQSGGPTIAINASLAGIIHRAKASQEFENVYGMINGIKGLLEGRYMDLLEEFDDVNPISNFTGNLVLEFKTNTCHVFRFLPL